MTTKELANVECIACGKFTDHQGEWFTTYINRGYSTEQSWDNFEPRKCMACGYGYGH